MTVLTSKEFLHLHHLAMLEPDLEKQDHTLEQLNRFFNMIEQIQQVDTDNIKPLHSPLDISAQTAQEQHLRDDKVTFSINLSTRDTIQKNAPAAQDGFYLVPKVVE